MKLLEHPVVQRVRERGALKLLRRLHRITHRLPVKLVEPEAATVLVVAPHMDDDVIGPGGTLALHRKLGSELHVVFCGAGATPEADATRKAEAQAAAEFMGFEPLRFLDTPEGQFSVHEAELSKKLTGVVAEVRPHVIFCPYFADHHRDHSATTMALCAAMERCGYSGEVWGYEVWSPCWPNVSVDITEVVETKRKAIELYASQVEGLHYVEGALGLNSYRGLSVYVRYAEAFFRAPAADFIAIAQEMNTL